jgi:hypothetical protein
MRGIDLSRVARRQLSWLTHRHDWLFWFGPKILAMAMILGILAFQRSLQRLRLVRGHPSSV